MDEKKEENGQVKLPIIIKSNECTDEKDLILLSANSNSLKNKLESLKFNMAIIKPHIIVIQETKAKRKGQFDLKGYRQYETVRGDNGGGLLLACISSIQPVLIFEGECECEILVVQVKVGDYLIRIIGGYGPQECAPIIVRETYRITIEEQVNRAYLAGCMILIAEDSNAKLGSEIIPGDPHTISENGKLLDGMIRRQNLYIANSSPLCDGGPITRRRVAKGKVEESCIDFVLMSQDLSYFLRKMTIDSNQLYALTKFTTTKGNPCIKRSDHFTIITNFKLKWKEEKPKREEMFKLRDEEGLEKFKQMTTKSNKLRECFNNRNNLNLEDACNKWYKEVDKVLHQCFTKIRITDVPPKKTCDFEIFQTLNTIKQLKEIHCAVNSMQKLVIQMEIKYTEQKVAELQGNKFRRLIAENNFIRDGAFSFNDVWKLKKKMYPQLRDAPFAVLDEKENLVTDHLGIINVMKEEFKHRLRNRVINPEYLELQQLKEYLCRLRLEITKSSDYNPWKINDLETAIKKLQDNKCKDPHGHINELYKFMGSDGLVSILDMMNFIKNELLIPSSFNLSNVSTICKGKGSKQKVVNLRGIFKLPIIRNILDRLISFDEQEQMSLSIGQFQVGNQKGRNIRDHTLIVHAVINEAKEKKVKLDLIFTDIKQCFDSVWLDEATNDLYDSGMTSRNLNLLYEGNKKTRMCIDTNFGRSQRIELNNVVMQGSVPGGLICSNQISKLCNKLYKEGNVYMYRNKLPVPALAMVDDVINVTICNSTSALTTNIKTDTFIQRKKLEGQVGDGKCQWVHIGGDECPSTYKMNENYITQSLSYKYLGDHVSNEWEILYTKRWEKAQGYSASCQAMCSEMSLGYHVYQIAKLLYQSIFLNGTLINMETWPNCTTRRIENFERIEQTYFRKILKAHSKTPIEAIYLELGVIPFRFHLMKRRIMYLSSIMKRDNDEFIRQFILLQKEECYDGDFYAQTKRDMIDLSISDNELTLSKEKLKTILSSKVNMVALNYLMNKAKSHSKVNETLYNNCDGSEYFRDQRFSPDLANLLFKFRTRTYLVKNNFRNNYKNMDILCPLCEKEDDKQEHLFQCAKIDMKNIEGEYIDIFSMDIDSLYNVAIKLKKLVEKRNCLLNPDEV